MLSFKQDEIYTATEVVRNFSPIMEKLKKSESGKIVILKNNKFEAVMLSMKEFERLQNAMQLLENIYKNQKATKHSSLRY
ncbi:type II toxin-antitoxin system Phd/YefM family antitoxin [Campylobacter jejuni]|nr:type II toxin-antitoxin system Phd/YefM family antitoxin [Campylobacter jejuni]